MLKSIMSFFFGNKQARDVKRLKPIVEEINTIFKELESLSDDELKNKTTEFRRALGVSPRSSRVGDQWVVHERAEDTLKTHPDIEGAVFVGTRRDAHPGDVAAWVKTKPGVTPSEDLAAQIRGGMTRLGPGYSPKFIYFIDEFPTKEGKGGRQVLDHHMLALATEQNPTENWEQRKWSEISGNLKREEDLYTCEDVLPEAFAVMKETCRRHLGKKWMANGIEITWNAVPFDVQLMGATSLAQGNISEMATGEGKTLTAIMPLYLRGLMCKGAHLVTVNDYLAKRDQEWNAPLFEFLGMTTGCLDKTESHTRERRAQYWADITYGTVNEFGFDYLRDNMARQRHQLVQRDYYFAIIDEVDSVLIDEARTPLIISGPVERSTAQYEKIIPRIRDLVAKQNMVVSRFAADADKAVEQQASAKEYEWETGLLLLKCFKGMPKHKRYMKLRQDPALQRLQERVELDLIAQKKMRAGAENDMDEVEKDLYFVVDEKNRMIELTEKGRTELSPNNPDYFVLSDIVDEFAKIEQNEELDKDQRDEQKRTARAAHDSKAEELHTISQLLNAFVLKQRDVDYVVEEDKVVIVDENTGRKMTGRRWSDGLHQAVEAKEGVKIEAETQTLATITIQNYFRMYTKLSGMTGTAETEAAEFHATYNMDVITIPTNRPLQRKDLEDVVFMSKREKYTAVLDEIERLHKLDLPILVGTTNVADSEKLSKMLSGRKLKHNVLNAKNHEYEAQIVQEGGRAGAITIATNMAGRGTDIKLGPGVAESRKDENGDEWPGGLQIIGTERHEARRIDRQLRGRSGRQGDPGTSRFFISLEDNLMLWFGSDRIAAWLQKFGIKEGDAIESPLVTRSVTNAQKKVEMVNHERRQKTLQFDNVMNGQRVQIYSLRRDILVEDDVRTILIGIFEDAIDAEFDMVYGKKDNMGDADIKGWLDWLENTIVTESLDHLKSRSWADYEDLHAAVMEHIVAATDEKLHELGEHAVPFARFIGLQAIDSNWQDHLLAIDDLREGVFLRSVGQKDPLIEFTRDAAAMFEEFMLTVNKGVFTTFFRATIGGERRMAEQQRVRRVVEQKAEAVSTPDAAAQQQQQQQAPQQQGRPKTGLTPYRRDMPKVGRNEPCPCGSGKKFKDCHGDSDEPVSHSVGGRNE